MITNKQERYWCCDLYPDNPTHERAIKLACLMPNTILMCHDRSVDKVSGEILKAHYHIIFKFQNGFYLFALIDKLGLNRDNDTHLFGSLKDYDFKNHKDYIVYLTHFNTDRPDKYSPDLFEGGLRQYAINIVRDYAYDDDVNFMDVLNTLEEMYYKHQISSEFDTMIYRKLYSKFGSIIFRKWSMIKSFINDYRGPNIDV